MVGRLLPKMLAEIAAAQPQPTPAISPFDQPLPYPRVGLPRPVTTPPARVIPGPWRLPPQAVPKVPWGSMIGQAALRIFFIGGITYTIGDLTADAILQHQTASLDIYAEKKVQDANAVAQWYGNQVQMSVCLAAGVSLPECWNRLPYPEDPHWHRPPHIKQQATRSPMTSEELDRLRRHPALQNPRQRDEMRPDKSPLPWTKPKGDQLIAPTELTPSCRPHDQQRAMTVSSAAGTVVPAETSATTPSAPAVRRRGGGPAPSVRPDQMVTVLRYHDGNRRRSVQKIGLAASTLHYHIRRAPEGSDLAEFQVVKGRGGRQPAVERGKLLSLLKKHNGNRSQVARELGISQQAVSKHILKGAPDDPELAAYIKIRGRGGHSGPRRRRAAPLVDPPPTDSTEVLLDRARRGDTGVVGELRLRLLKEGNINVAIAIAQAIAIVLGICRVSP